MVNDQEALLIPPLKDEGWLLETLFGDLHLLLLWQLRVGLCLDEGVDLEQLCKLLHIVGLRAI